MYGMIDYHISQEIGKILSRDGQPQKDEEQAEPKPGIFRRLLAKFSRQEVEIEAVCEEKRSALSYQPSTKSG